jgi:hypothetical protein
MDEIGLIRHQLGTEHDHLDEAARAFAILAGQSESKEIFDFTIKYAYYLTYYIMQSTRRVALIAQMLARGVALAAPERARLDAIAPLQRTTEAACAQIEKTLREPLAACARSTALRIEIDRATDSLLESLRRMRAVVEPLAERHFGLSDWRSAAQFSADSVLEERRRFAEIMTLSREATAAAAGVQ